MSQNDSENFEFSQDSAQQGQKEEKLVAVSEAIRYRKRAQIAEQKLEVAHAELEESGARIENLNSQLEDINLERQLIAVLAQSGACDMEAALLIGKARMEKNPQADVGEIISQMKKEKGHLFAAQSGIVASSKTSGAKESAPSVSRSLVRAADKAASSGSRVDMQEYLRLRRNFF